MRRDDEKGEIFKIAKQMARINQGCVGEKNGHGDLAFGGCAKEDA